MVGIMKANIEVEQTWFKYEVKTDSLCGIGAHNIGGSELQKCSFLA